MKLKGHFFWTFLYLLIWCFFLENIAFIFIGLAVVIGDSPDLDNGLKEGSHRFILAHSLFFPILTFICFPHVVILLCILAVGHHCSLDTVGNLIFGRGNQGYYTICIIPSFTVNLYIIKFETRSLRLSGRQTTIFLLLNFIISIIIGVWWLTV